MLSDTNTIQKLRRFLDRLRLGDFKDELSNAFTQLNVFLKSNIVAQEYISKQYLPEIYNEGRFGMQQITFIVSKSLEYIAPSLASALSDGLVDLYSQTDDEEILNLLFEVILKYNIEDVINVESTGQNFRLENETKNFLLRVDTIRRDLRLSLLQLALKKYSRMLLSESLPSSQELPSVFKRLNHVIMLLLKFEDKVEQARQTALLPFASFDDIIYAQSIALKLFGSELDALKYDEQLLSTYLIPLFPVIEADKLGFTADKITFTNEGKGCLPPAIIRVQASDKEFELGELGRIIGANEVSEFFIEESGTLASFLRSLKPNIDIKVIFSFKKFGRFYDFAMVAQSVGNWLEKMPRTIHEIVLPYELPLSMLKDDKEFERLCCWIISEDPKGRFKDVIWLNEDGGGERGRDVLATEVSTGKKYVFQCKRADKFSPSVLEKELLAFSKYVSEDPSIKPDVYVFFLSSSITDQTKSIGDKLARQIGMDIDYWSKGTIDRLVRTNRIVSERFWKTIEFKHNPPP